jgi:hypothetical protein
MTKRFFCLLPLTAALLAGLATTSPAASAAVTAGGRVTLQSPTRLIDTRGGAKVTEVPLPVGLVSVFVVDATSPTLVDVHPCGGTDPATTDRALTTLLPQYPEVRAVVVDTAGTCLRASKPINVAVDRVGSIESEPSAAGLQFVADSRPLRDGPVAVNSSTVVSLGTVPSTARGAAIRIEGRRGEARSGYVLSCGGVASTLFPDPWPAGIFPRAGTIAYLPLEVGATSVCLYSSEAADLDVSLVGWFATDGPDPTSLPPHLEVVASDIRPSGLEAVAPVRVLDTRDGTGASPPGPLEAGDTLVLDLADHLTEYSTAAVLNVTVTSPDEAGYLTVYPCDDDQPTASNLNFVADQTVPNLVTVPVAGDGTVCLFTSAATDVIADFSGSYEFGGGDGANPTDPTRIMDSRNGTGVPVGKIAAVTPVKLQVAGPGRAVPTGATAATMNVTVTGPTAAGYMTVYPCDAPRPTASNLNYATDETVPNLVTVKLAADGSVCLYSQSATHAIVDVAAWFGEGDEGFRPLTPTRVLDTRSAVGIGTKTRVESGQVVVVDLDASLPTVGTAALINITVTNPESAGYVTVYPCDQTRPTASNLNFVAGETVPNLVSAKLSAAGTVCIYSDSRTHLIADLAGYVTADPDTWWTNELSAPSPGS